MYHLCSDMTEMTLSWVTAHFLLINLGSIITSGVIVTSLHTVVIAMTVAYFEYLCTFYL